MCEYIYMCVCVCAESKRVEVVSVARDVRISIRKYRKELCVCVCSLFQLHVIFRIGEEF